MCVTRSDVYDLSRVHFCIAQAALLEMDISRLPVVPAVQ